MDSKNPTKNDPFKKGNTQSNPGDAESSFSMDSEKTSLMPSVTRLLNRKTLGLQKGDEYLKNNLTPPPVPQDQTQLFQNQISPGEVLGPSNEEIKFTALESSPEPSPPIQNTQALVQWNLDALRSVNSELSQKVLGLLEKSPNLEILFLKILPPEIGQKMPYFEAQAFFSPSHRESEWQGALWRPSLVPDLWNSFIRSGIGKLPPSASQIEQKMLRQALGTRDDEWLTALRIGSAQKCKGVVFVFSKNEIHSIP